MGIYIIIIGVILVAIVLVNNLFDTKKFISDTKPYFDFLMEKDYKFYCSVKYGDDVDYKKLYDARVKKMALVFVVALVACSFSMGLKFITIILAAIIAYVVFKLDYINLSSYYKRHLVIIDQMLPYYLKGLEILVQHYTVPVALSRSIEDAPEIFKDGLKKLVARIEAGDSSVDPYMEFAKDYPVRDSMRMMRLLYRLSLGSNENKQEQLMMFSKNVSSLQNKAREVKYANRLEKMENMTMQMLMGTGGIVLVLMMIAMLGLMNF